MMNGANLYISKMSIPIVIGTLVWSGYSVAYAIRL